MFQTSGQCSKSEIEGRPRNMTAADNRYNVLTGKRNRRSTAALMASQLYAAIETQISCKTVVNLLATDSIMRLKTSCACPMIERSSQCPFSMVSSASSIDRRRLDKYLLHSKEPVQSFF